MDNLMLMCTNTVKTTLTGTVMIENRLDNGFLYVSDELKRKTQQEEDSVYKNTMADYYDEDDYMDFEHSFRGERLHNRSRLQDDHRDECLRDRNRVERGMQGNQRDSQRRGNLEGRRERSFQDGDFRDRRGPDDRIMFDRDDDMDFVREYADARNSDRNWEMDRDRSRRDREGSHRDWPRDRRDEGMQGRQLGRSRDRSPRDSRDKSPRNSRDRSPRASRRRVGQAMDREGSLDRPPKEESPWMRYKTNAPTRIVMLTGLPSSTEDADIYPSFHPFHASVQDIRIIRNMTSGVGGECRGFGFIVFVTIDDAEKWMGKTKRSITVREEKVTLHFSRPFDQPTPNIKKDFGWYRWTTDEPSSNLVIWNIPEEVEVSQIEEEIAETGAKLEDCIILTDRSSGKRRGFGFIDFGDKESAEKWYNESKGILVLPGGSILSAYSNGSSKHKRKPWNCIKCGTVNFRRRDFCFTCKISRADSEFAGLWSSSGDGSEAVGNNPCDTLIFRGLDALTTEETLNRALQWTTGKFCKNIVIMRDPFTKVSMSHAFGEFTSIAEAKEVFDKVWKTGPPLEVDGKQIMLSYAKNTFNTIMATQVQTQYQSAPEVQIMQPTGQVVQPAAQIVSDKSANTTVSAETPTADSGEVNSAAKSETSKKEIKKKKKTDTDKEKKTTAQDKKVNYLELTLLPVNGFFYDPKEDKYYSSKIVKKCPVKDCKLKKGKKWLTLQRHWQSVHFPTKRAFQCVRGKCKSSKKTYSTTKLFFRHLDAHNDMRKRDYEAELSKAKIKLVSNKNFIDPGTAVLPAPVLTAGPQIDIPETKCPVKKCPHSYTTFDNMKEHWAQYHSSNVTMYRCGVCDTIDRDKKLMTDHMNEKHGDMDTKLEKVILESKQYIDPENVVPFWSLYRSSNADDDGEDADIEDELGPDFPLAKIPAVDNDPEDLCEFLTWTERYMHRLDTAYKDAVRDLQKTTQRQLDKK